MIIVFVVCFQFLLGHSSGKICPGFCLPKEHCEKDGGKFLGYCVDRRVCCDVSHKLNRSTCGEVVSSWSEARPAEFVSLDYPGHSSGSLVCQFELKLDSKTVGIKLELVKFELEAALRVGGDKEAALCDADMFFIKGFSDWMTDPICGYFTGFSMLIDIEKNDYPGKKITLLFLMSSKKYRWKIKIHQVSTQRLKKSELCLRTRMLGWSKSRDFPKKIFWSNRNSASSDVNLGEEGPDRWKWDVDIVSTTKPSGGCEDSANGTEDSFPLLYKLCSGTILDDRHVLTAASCLTSSHPQHHNVKNIKILTSAFCPVNGRNPRQHFYEVEGVTMHFNQISPMKHNDIAVIRTKREISFGDKVQPISIFGGRPKYLAFSFKQESEGSKTTIQLNPREPHECSLTQAQNMKLPPRSLIELQGSNKYKHLLGNWICFGSRLSQNMSACAENLNLLRGNSLVGANEAGEDVMLVAMFSHVFRQTPNVAVDYLWPWNINLSSLVNQTMSKTSSERGGKAFAYFAKIDFFRKWILMAIY